MRAFVPILTLLIADVKPANLPPFQQPLRGDHYKNGIERTDAQKVHHEYIYVPFLGTRLSAGTC